MASIPPIPVELLTRIFESCDDFPQVVALASVCKGTHAAWVTNSGTIIWSVAKSQIRSFDDALMAVRATAIVLKAYQAGTSPPVVAMNSLSGNSKLPDVAELKEVFNMQYLVRCIEWMYFNSRELHLGECEDNLFKDMKYGHYPSDQRRFPECLSKDIPGAKNATIDSFRDGFYRAMYRLLLAGAVLAKPYMAPLFQARKEGGKDGFFNRCGLEDYSHKYWDKIDKSEDGPPRPEDIAYIRQFPVYNYDMADWSDVGLWRNREYESCFGPFASWIIEDGRKRQQNEPQDPNYTVPEWAENPTDVGAVRELMLLLVAYDHFSSKFQNPIWARTGEAAYTKKQGNRTVSIVRFGIFQIEEITMPAAFEDLTTGYLSAAYHPALEGSQGEDIPLQFDIWSNTVGLLDHRKRNHHDRNRENPGPPAMLEVWHFALRRYLNLGFRSKTFWMPRRPFYMQSLWWKEVGRGEIFLNPNWAPVQKYKPGVVSWDHETN
ncbi:hypothetical protein BDZ45DRAFT_808142 [Acephala macrosclerotiorum]|nr:hypothetical protein BDZ45DRAFT_808142 [Acephala macrosclerotiorum]